MGELLDVITVLAGHTYDVGGTPRGESRGAEGGGGLGTTTIVALAALALATVGLLVQLSSSAARAKLKTAAPLGLTAVIILAPLLAWAAASGGDDDVALLIVERSKDVKGAPEVLMSLTDDELNTLSSTNGRRIVRVQCLAADGEVVVDGQQPWPFVEERGFDAPHAHQPASRDELARTERCRVLGTRDPLEAEIRGPLPG
jgi:hypothetical protein